MSDLRQESETKKYSAGHLLTRIAIRFLRRARPVRLPAPVSPAMDSAQDLRADGKIFHTSACLLKRSGLPSMPASAQLHKCRPTTQFPTTRCTVLAGRRSSIFAARFCVRSGGKHFRSLRMAMTPDATEPFTERGSRRRATCSAAAALFNANSRAA